MGNTVIVNPYLEALAAKDLLGRSRALDLRKYSSHASCTIYPDLQDWIFYIGYLYQDLVYSDWTPSYSVCGRGSREYWPLETRRHEAASTRGAASTCQEYAEASTGCLSEIYSCGGGSQVNEA